MLWLMVPFVLVIAQLQFYHGYSGFTPGQSATVKVRLRDAAVPASGAAPAIALQAPVGLSVQSPVVWIPSAREAAWRIGLEQPGDHVLTITLDGHTVTKQVRVSDRVGWRTPERREAEFINAVLHPAEPPIAPDVPIEVVSVTYPERQLSLLGQPVGWMVVFFTLSLLLALVLRARFGIVI